MNAEHDRTEPPVLPGPISYEDSLAFSQGVRRLVANELIKGGVPTDQDGVKLLMTVLKDSDTTALNDRKNKIDQDTANTGKEVVDAMMQLLPSLSNRNPFMRQADGSVAQDVAVEEVPVPSVDPSKLGDFPEVEGEEHIGIVSEDINSFLARVKPIQE